MFLPSIGVTTLPPPESSWTRAAATVQLIGLLLMVLGLTALPVVLWRLEPLVAAACLAAYAIAAGYLLATTEFGEN